MTQKTHDKRTAPSKRLTIEPPPKEAGPESLYRAVYVIDIGAKSPRQAAKRAHTLMQDPDSMPPVLDILDSTGRRTRVDLSKA
jgi:hypothetical protein